MNLRLLLLRLHVPRRLRLAELRALTRAVEEGFGRAAPDPEGSGLEAELRRLTRFTKTCALEAISAGQAGAGLRGRLHARALEMGQRLRRELHVRSVAESFQALGILYGALGVDWSTAADGSVEVRSCRFAAEYTPEVCELVSELDRGIVEGITAGGHLRFEERLSEGKSCCRARVDWT